MQIEVRETIIGKRRHGFTSDAVSPEIFAQPVTEFGGVTMNVFANSNSHPADGRALDVYAKLCDRLLGRHAS